MVQIQSTWFPIIDRNPQKFVPSIYQAKAGDFGKVTQRIYGTAKSPSHIVLPVMPNRP
jgi:predicted acyl esterase